MNEYQIGKDIGIIFSRLDALEHKATYDTCQVPKGGEGIVRRMTPEEEELAGKQLKKGRFCVYAVAGFVGKACPGIKIGDFICVSPCPPCPDIARLVIVDAKGAPICTLIVRFGAAGGCDQCPPGSKRFVWAA